MSAKPALDKSDIEEVQRARTAFLLGLLDVSWRLATIFMLPVIIGYAIDTIRGSSNFVIIGLILGVLFSVLFIIKQALDVNKQKTGKKL